eukprot:TRINITY_DN20395_c0_g1_i1.p1 TRINITY_DN20395_c0_g1~~TRINITY_DN20395_c0_g1_i1.p1  ORF type:complete len:267 (-),score=40.81 TRINITY_DN20395_c0_g1_i1:131-931(-)
MNSRLVMYLSVADLIQSLASTASWMWIRKAPVIGTSGCTYQGFMFEYGNVASSFASAVIGTYVFCNIFSFDYPKLKINKPKRFEIISVIFIFGLSLLFALIGFMRSTPNHIFYAPVGYGGWCWISEYYSIERFMIHYTWIFLICFYLFFIYLMIGFTVAKSSQIDKKSSRRTRKIFRKVAGFPIIFALVFLPLGLERLITWSNPVVPVPPAYLAFAVSIFVLNGFFNALLYGISRRIFQNLCRPDQTKSSSTATPKTQDDSKFASY